VLVREFGLVTAAVFGAVWRYCQMENRVCNASTRTIADDLGMEHGTVLRHIKKLCKAGYLRDETPGLRNKPHTYSDTGKVKITGLVEVATGAQDTTTGAQDTTTGAQDTTTGAQDTTTGVLNQLKRVSKRVSKKPFKESESRTQNKVLSENRLFGIKLTEVCGYSGPEFVVNSKLGDCAAAVVKLIEWSATVEQLDQFGRWWWGQTPPTFNQVVDEWGKFLAVPNRPDQHSSHAASAVKLDPDWRAAYESQLAADRIAVAETAERVEGVMNGTIITTGINVNDEIRKLAQKKEM